MAHKTKINGTTYDIVGGSTLINGTGYNITNGKTLINGIGYDIPFTSTNNNSFTWVGWENATWEDINNLCIAKQNGEIDEWPNDITVGTSSKTLTCLNTPSANATYGIYANEILSVYTAVVACFDELPGTITFYTIPDTNTQQKISFSGVYNQRWDQSNAREKCDYLYNILGTNANDYIMPVVKRSSTNFDSNNPPETETTIDTTDYFFLPAGVEFQGWYGTSSLLEGTVYNGTLLQNFYYQPQLLVWTRSRYSRGAYNLQNVMNWTTAVTSYRNAYFAPWFIIGNPNA